MRVLVVNPNTSAEVSERLGTHVANGLPRGAEVDVCTARFGAPYIADEVSFAVGAHAAIDAWQAHVATHGEPDATLLGCFGDPGLHALRALARGPVIGLAEASLQAAAGRGRYAIVTGGAAWGPMLGRVVRAFDLATRLVRIETVAPSGAELAADRERALRVLADACRRAGEGADAVLLGGAGLAGLAAELRPVLDGIALLDSVEEATARLTLPPGSDRAPDRIAG